jgi:hypothetical protein
VKLIAYLRLAQGLNLYLHSPISSWRCFIFHVTFVGSSSALVSNLAIVFIEVKLTIYRPAQTLRVPLG